MFQLPVLVISSLTAMACLVLTLSLLLFWVPEFSSPQQCSTARSVSDIGGVECVLLTPYYQYQWAICLTHNYIVQYSNEEHICHGYAPICWYQCMMKLYDVESGTMNSACGCTPGEVTTEAPTDNLPPHCYIQSLALTAVGISRTKMTSALMVERG